MPKGVWTWGMVMRRLLFLLVVASMVLTSLTAAGATAGVPDDISSGSDAALDLGGGAEPRARPATKSHRFADPALTGVVRLIRQGRRVPVDTARVVGGMVRVEVLGTPGTRVAKDVRAVGGRVVESLNEMALADVPSRRLRQLEGRLGVAMVRLPRVTPSAVRETGMRRSAGVARRTGTQGQEAVVKTAVAPWHSRGFLGQSVKVGIIDYFDPTIWSAAAGLGEVPTAPNGTFCKWNGETCDVWTSHFGQGAHGVAVAEAIKDIAPGAELYLASASAVTADTKAVVDYFASQGVRIVSRSLGARYDGPGDGTGELDDVIAYAESKGIAWFNAAGNAGGYDDPATAEIERIGGYFRGGLTDVDNDQWMEFPGGGEYLAYRCGSIAGLRWSDWATNRTDYDLYLYKEANDATLFAASEANQPAGSAPIEWANATNGCSGVDWDYLSVFRFAVGNGNAGETVEFYSDVAVDKWQNPYAAALAGSDMKNPGAAAVGAVDPWDGVSVARYSSWGPTNDGRTKPDLSAVSNFSSQAYSSSTGRFNGTSAATPVVAGGAAVLLSSSPGLTPAQLVAALKGQVTDRGEAGPDNIFGTGELTFGSPPAANVPSPPAAHVAVTSAVVRPVMRHLAKRLPVKVSWTSSVPQSSAQVVRSLNRGDYKPAAATNGSRGSVRTKMVLERHNQFAIQVRDAAGTASPWYATASLSPTIYDDRSRTIKYGTGWQRLRSSGAHRHTLTATKAGAGPARMTFRGSAVSLVMTKSANSGRVRVFADGKAVAKVNLRSRKIDHKRIVLNLYGASKGRHSIMLEPLTRGASGWVYLDGILVMR